MLYKVDKGNNVTAMVKNIFEVYKRIISVGQAHNYINIDVFFLVHSFQYFKSYSKLTKLIIPN